MMVVLVVVAACYSHCSHPVIIIVGGMDGWQPPIPACPSHSHGGGCRGRWLGGGRHRWGGRWPRSARTGRVLPQPLPHTLRHTDRQPDTAMDGRHSLHALWISCNGRRKQTHLKTCCSFPWGENCEVQVDDSWWTMKTANVTDNWNRCPAKHSLLLARENTGLWRMVMVVVVEGGDLLVEGFGWWCGLLVLVRRGCWAWDGCVGKGGVLLAVL